MKNRIESNFFYWFFINTALVRIVGYVSLWYITNFTAFFSGCKGLMELVVIIDGSDSINEPDYNSLKRSMTSLVQSLDIQEAEIRISFIVFSSDIALETPLVGNKPQALQTAATLPHPRDGTNTWMALEAM